MCWERERWREREWKKERERESRLRKAIDWTVALEGVSLLLLCFISLI